MKITEAIKSEVCYFFFELTPLPLAELGLNENLKYGYARILNSEDYLGYYTGIYLCGIYDYFTELSVKDIEKVKGQPFLFNQKLIFAPVLRGKYKWTFIGSEPMNSLNLPDDLPHMVFSHIHKNDNETKTYYKNGVYATSIGLGQKHCETEYKNVKHLGETDIENTNYLFQFIYAEFLKREKKKYSDAELLVLLKKFFSRVGEWDGRAKQKNQRTLNSFKEMLASPVYREIPEKYREKAINEVDG